MSASTATIAGKVSAVSASSLQIVVGNIAAVADGTNDTVDIQTNVGRAILTIPGQYQTAGSRAFQPGDAVSIVVTGPVS